jgi:hypothetical protein
MLLIGYLQASIMIDAAAIFLALRYKVWACPIPAVENEGKNGIRESRKSSIAP